jgi:hypothetical protein
VYVKAREAKLLAAKAMNVGALIFAAFYGSREKSNQQHNTASDIKKSN